MDIYKNRIADCLLKDMLDAVGGVLVEGPKWCGKTTTSAHIAKSVLFMDDPNTKEQNLLIADTNITTLLQGDTPRLIDEWELAPKLWDAARFEIDHRPNGRGQFIFTGSSVPKQKNMSQIHHSGTGRFGRLLMRPMSLWESGESLGTVSLAELFGGQIPSAANVGLSLNDIAFLTCRGGWPASVSAPDKVALKTAGIYLDGVVETDIYAVDDVRRDKDFMMRIIRSLARNQGCQVPISTIHSDLKSNSQSSLNEDTIAEYVSVLKKIFLEEDMIAWNPNLRSKSAIRTSDTRYFVDSSIATSALGLGPDDLMKDLNTFGFLFETLAVRDLRVYTDALGGNVYHYRDSNSLECDAVIHLRNGKYGLVEIKLGGDKSIADGVKTLNMLASKIDTEKMYEPSFKMVLTAIGKYAYRRPDGVDVVPIGCLKN